VGQPTWLVAIIVVAMLLAAKDEVGFVLVRPVVSLGKVFDWDLLLFLQLNPPVPD
jgi:hypothetical protein